MISNSLPKSIDNNNPDKEKYITHKCCFYVGCILFVIIILLCVLYFLINFLGCLTFRYRDEGRWCRLSPNAKSLLITYPNEKTLLYDVHTLEETILSEGKYEGGFSFSPDGQELVFTRGDKFGGSLWTMKIDGSQQERITHVDRVLDLKASFSPDGKQIAFIRLDAWLSGYLMIYDRTTKHCTSILSGLNRYHSIIRWKNNTTLLYKYTENSLYEVDLTYKSSRNIYHVPPDYVDSVYSRVTDISVVHNKELAVTCPNKKYHYQLGIRDFGTSDMYKILTDIRYNVCSAEMSYDGNYILFMTSNYTAPQKAKRGIYLLDTNTNTVTPVPIVLPETISK